MMIDRVYLPISICGTLCAGLVFTSQLLHSFSLQYTMSVVNVPTIARNSLFNYNLWVGVKNLWENGALYTALLIGLVSGILPYIKCFLLIISATNVSQDVSKQYKIAKYLYIFGKLTIFDIFFVSYLTNTIQYTTYLGFAKITLNGLVGVGAYTFLFACIASQILCLWHLILARRDFSQLE